MAELQTRSMLHRVLYCILMVLLMTTTSEQQECNVFRPSKYAYARADIENSNTDSESCNIQEVNNRSYFLCNEGGRVGDQDTGPQTLPLFDTRHYYNWTREGGEMLFEFPRSATLTSVILHFYLDFPNKVARPKLKLVEVDNSFNLSHIADPLPTDRTPTAIDSIDEENLSPGLYNETIILSNNRAPASKLVLVVFDNKLFHFVMSEITFCTAEHVTNPATTSESLAIVSTNKGTVADVTKFTTVTSDERTDRSAELQRDSSGQKQLKMSLVTLLVSLITLLLMR